MHLLKEKKKKEKKGGKSASNANYSIVIFIENCFMFGIYTQPKCKHIKIVCIPSVTSGSSPCSFEGLCVEESEASSD